ncbi:uncharacterized protein EHS24_005128 [Apiotrichum porosum]|uniref:Uncharacterized protein n=1 Tax=Apiotrichum porosum TaxID=105984 RepID=A0A427Y6Y6_9TREE|nr:uncharacterized protein EHS24_005128 [Apiotrichum porosum]RSH86850.1 hypothetical protein EHS24_005128 [Apiotrichum porosum]
MHVDADADLHDVFRILYDGDEWASDNDDEDAGDEQQLGEGVQTATSTEGSIHSRRYSKARFVTALDALVAPSSTPTVPAKRRIYAVPQPTSSVISSTAPLPADLNGKTYAPYSPLPLLARVRTFPPTFPSSLPGLSPMTLALAGWTYAHGGVVCASSSTCEKWGLGGLESLPSRSRDEVVRRLASSLPQRHTLECGWRTRASPATLPTQLRRLAHPLVTASLEPLAAALQARSIGPEPPRWACPVSASQLATLAAGLERYAAAVHGATLAIDPLAAALALFGWYPYDPVAPANHVAEQEHGHGHAQGHGHAAHTDIVACRLCLRRVGLWTFTATAASSDEERKFDVEGEHQ